MRTRKGKQEEQHTSQLSTYEYPTLYPKTLGHAGTHICSKLPDHFWKCFPTPRAVNLTSPTLSHPDYILTLTDTHTINKVNLNIDDHLMFYTCMPVYRGILIINSDKSPNIDVLFSILYGVDYMVTIAA